MSIRIVPAADVDFDAFTRTLNAAYADYFVPLNMAPDELRQRILQDDILLEGSRVALRNDIPVGLGMLAKRDTRGWIGGLGVLPDQRGAGVGRLLMDDLLAAARGLGIKEVQLEVIIENERAFKLYDSLGFVKRRVLHVAEGRPRPEADERFGYRRVPVADVLALYPTFHTGVNPWQRELALLERLASRLEAYVVEDDGETAAYGLGVFLPNTIRFVDLALAPGKAPALRALVAYLHRQHPAATGSIINIAEDDPAWAVLFVLGYKPYLSQYEMTLPLT